MAEVLPPVDIDDQEDGEILDDEEDDAPLELPVHLENLQNYASSDEDGEEEILQEYVKKVEERKQQQPVEEKEIDPKLCKVCMKNEHKYRCPRCDVRSCSLACSKKHKEDSQCDGVRQPFIKVDKPSEYDGRKSIDDQKFMQDLKERVGLGTETISASNELTHNDVAKDVDPNDLRLNANSGSEKYLLNAARFRHIWLGFKQTEGNESRHEQFSDTIFWTLRLLFRKQAENGEVVDFEKIINNIPETIRVSTVLKQFFKPRKVGCIVSESDLDIPKLTPFIEKGIEEVNVFMEVHNYAEKYYGILTENTIIDNTRNRVIADYPKFIITLKDEFVDMQLLNPEELEEIKVKYGGVSTGTTGTERFSKGPRGGHGGGRGFHRGNGRGGGHGHNGNNFNRKRHGDNMGHNNFKRGRGGGHGGYNNRGGRNFNRNHSNNVDSFDPFEPFAGPTRLPVEYNTASKH